MQILVIEEGLYTIIAGIYTFIARIYDIMLKLVQSGSEAGSIADFYISDVATVMYTIAGVFMLFRVTIAMINMLINPDAINDGKAGAGKLITRIVTSILLLIVFVPNGFIFGDDGILTRLEGALLAKDGLISNIMPNSKTSQVKGTAMNVERATKTVIDNVYAAPTDVAGDTSKTVLDCYWVNIVTVDEGTKESDRNGGKNTIRNKYHVTFYTENGQGRKAVTKKGTTGSGNNELAYDNNKTPTIYYSVDGSYPYSGLGNTFYEEKAFTNGLPKECPKLLKENGSDYYSYMTYDKDGVYWYNYGTGIVGGWEKEEDMNASLEKHADEFYDVNPANRGLLGGVSDAATAFAQNSMGTFLTCNTGTDCASLKAQALLTPEGNAAIKSALGNDTMELEFIPALIAGIGILVWIVVLCVDVIIRRFKLLLLQMIAPIPIISYADPNDQMFNKWGKMYISTYLDLFLKLIAISFAVSLLEIVWVIRPNSAIETFFYVVAILVFAKMIPSMISDIFGIKLGSGTFKDITGMGKAALGFGAGAAIGGVVGAATGTGIVGRASGFINGALRGAGSGAKGNILGGGKSIAKSNYVENAAKKSGMGFFDRKMAAFTGSLGLQDAYTKAEKDKTRNDEFVAAADSLDKEAGNRVQQSISSGQYKNATGRAAKAGKAISKMVDAQNLAHDVEYGAKIKKWQGDFSADGQSATYVNKLTGETKTFKRSDFSNDDDFVNAAAAFSNENITFYEAQSQLYGAELAAKNEVISLTRSDSKALLDLGINQEGADILSDRLDVADVYAKRAGFDGYSKDNKASADANSRAASKTMIDNEASHLYSQQK